MAAIAEQWLQLHQDPPVRRIASVEIGRPSRSTGRNRPRQSFHCDYCSCTFALDSQRESHVLETHIADESDRSPVALSKPLLRIGGKVLDRLALRREQSGEQKPAWPLKSIQSVRRMIWCEKCRCDVRSDRMDIHLRERCPARNSTRVVHTSPSSATRNAVPGSGSGSARRLSGNVISGGSTKPVYLDGPGLKGSHPTSGASDSSADARTEYRENRRLDGSRDYRGYREGGRFGSHSSFDASDDESAP